MKKTLTSKILSLLMAVLMVFGVASTGLIVMAETVSEEINYVSLGDSMTNGYGFEGYEQGNYTNGTYDFLNDVGIYGEGSYALQFEEYLAAKFNATVNHTKLAPSALLADDLLYLLGARDEEFDDDWAGYRDYVGDYDNPENIDALKEHFQTAITEADIMTMCIGNASFGAYLVQQVTDAIGIMGSTPDVDEQLTLENGLALLEDEEAKEIVLDIYADMKEYVTAYVADIELLADYDMDVILDIVAYTVASFLVSYEDVLDVIIEMNPDVEIILIGLMNTTYGMVITGEVNGKSIEFPFGDMMDEAFGALNAYIAAIPALKQAAGEYEDATFYYAEQPEPAFIVQAFDDLAANNWNNIDNGRLSGQIVRQRNIDAYNDFLRGAIGGALGFALPKISLDDVANYVPVGDATDSYKATAEFAAQAALYATGTSVASLPRVQQYITATNDVDLSDAASNAAWVFKADIEKEISIAIYLAIEEAVVDNVDTMELSIGGLMGIANDVFGALGEMPEELSGSPGPVTIRTALVNWFNGSENGRAMCKVYALFKVGNGMSVHPTPTGHDNIFNAVVAAYEGKYTAGNHMDSLVKPYIDEAIEYYKDLGLDLIGIVEKNLKPVAEELAGKLEVLGGELEAKIKALNAKLEELTKLEGEILADMLAEREALVNELAALEEELAGIYAEPVNASGLPTKKMSATTVADTEAEFVVELEAAIAETKAAIEELDAAIIYVKNQIETDKLGIEDIKAAIEVIKTNIAETEEALAEVNAAMITLAADLVELGKALEVLGEASENIYDLTAGKIDAEKVYEAVKTVIETVPAVIDALETIYDEAVEAIENAQAAAQAIKDSAEAIKANVENLLASAEKLEAVEAEKAEAVKATANEIYDLAEKFAEINLPTVEKALNETAGEIEVVIKEEIAKAEALWEEYQNVVFAALYIAYQYCDNKGYITLATDYVTEKKALVESKLEDLKADLAEAEVILEAQLEELNKKLMEEYPEVEKAIEDLKAELLAATDAEVRAQYEALIAKLEAKKAALEAKIEEAKVAAAKIKAYIEAVEAAIEETEKALADVCAQLEVVGTDVEAVLEAICALKKTLCDLGCSVGDLAAIINDEVLELLGYANLINEKILAVIDSLEVYADLFEDGVAITKSEIIEAVDTFYAYVELFAGNVEAFIAAVEDLIANGVVSKDEIIALFEELIENGTEAAKEELLAALKELVYNATHADYEKDEDSYYVAFGDSTAVSESYVDLLAKELGIEYNNLAQAGLKVEDMFDIINVNVAEIKKADLITIGFGNNTFITEAINNALNYEVAPEYDWVKYVGEDGAQYVAEALAEIKAKLEAEGMGEIAGISVSDLAVTAIESYAYSCVAYAVNLPIIANEISNINPEALVILVGTYNPLDGVVIDLGETKLDVSEYLDYLAKAAGLESLIYSIVTDDAIYVDAPDVETKLTDKALDLLDIMKEFAIDQGASLDPSAAGHEYIKDQILDALNIVEEAEQLIGDANNDGAVNSIDAMYILQYDVELIGADEINLTLADVNGDGKVNSIDAMYILRYDAELIEKFPVENKAA